MIKESELTKLYYSIGEVADMFSVNTSLIRFWEKEFPALKPKKGNNGNRKFSPQEVLELQKIYHLVKEKGFTLKGAKQALKDKSLVIEEAKDTFNKAELIQRLEEIKQKIITLR